MVGGEQAPGRESSVIAGTSPIVPPDPVEGSDFDVMVRAAALDAAVASVLADQLDPSDVLFDNHTVHVMMRSCAFEYYLRTGKIALPYRPDDPEGSD